MKLTFKLSLALVLGVLVVLGGFAWVRIQREVALFDGDMRRDHRVLGATLATAVDEALLAHDSDAASRLVHRVDASHAGVTIRWVMLSPEARHDRRPTISSAEIGPLRQGTVVQLVRNTAPSIGADYGDERLFSYFPTAPLEGAPSAVEISESVSPRNRYLTETVRNTLVASLAVALVCGLLSFLLGAHYVGRPVAYLVHKAREIGRGELGAPVKLRQRDELGQLADEIESMSSQLHVARVSAERELEARISAHEQLRHAERLTTAGKLTSALAHELGTPLNVMAGHAQLIARGKVAGTEAVESAQVVADQCRRVARLVRGLLDYARRRPPVLHCADLGDTVKRTVALLSPLAAGRNVDLEVKAEHVALARVDDAQIQQALTNLIVNAVHASAAGNSIEIELTAVSAPRPGRSAAEAQPMHRLSVMDHGTGVSPEHLPRIFEPFFTTKPSGEGTGLGLGIAQQIIFEHGGWISVDSKLNQGTRFDIYLDAHSKPTSNGV